MTKSISTSRAISSRRCLTMILRVRSFMCVYESEWMLIASVEEDKKTLCQLLGKLYLPDQVDDDKLRSLKLLIHNLSSVRLSLHSTPSFTHSPSPHSAAHYATPPPETPSPNSKPASTKSTNSSWPTSTRMTIVNWSI